MSVSTWVSEELVELMTQLELSRSRPSSLQCRVGWGYPPGQLQNSCSVSPDEVSAQHLGVECGGSISKNSTWLETPPSHSSQHLRAGSPASFFHQPPWKSSWLPCLSRSPPCVPQPQGSTAPSDSQQGQAGGCPAKAGLINAQGGKKLLPRQEKHLKTQQQQNAISVLPSATCHSTGPRTSGTRG